MNKSLATTILILVVLCLLPWAVGAEKKPVVAVFDIESQDSGLKKATLTKLTAYLSVLMAEGGFQIIPRDQILARMKSQKAKSYKSCYDSSCQVELGRELAAQKSLATQILGIGGSCRVVTTLFDLKRAAAEKAATSKAKCNEKELLAAIESVAKKMTAGPDKGKTPEPSTPAPVAQPAGKPKVASKSPKDLDATCPVEKGFKRYFPKRYSITKKAGDWSVADSCCALCECGCGDKARIECDKCCKVENDKCYVEIPSGSASEPTAADAGCRVSEGYRKYFPTRFSITKKMGDWSTADACCAYCDCGCGDKARTTCNKCCRVVKGKCQAHTPKP